MPTLRLANGSGLLEKYMGHNPQHSSFSGVKAAQLRSCIFSRPNLVHTRSFRRSQQAPVLSHSKTRRV